jgi:hypothetical protein
LTCRDARREYFEASDLVLTPGSIVISGTGTYMSDDSGAGLTAAFST